MKSSAVLVTGAQITLSLRFGEISIETRDIADKSANITTRFRATGFYHINPSFIIDSNLASSQLTHSGDA